MSFSSDSSARGIRTRSSRIIYKLSGQYYVRQAFPDGSQSKHVVKRRKTKQGLRFKGPDTSGTGDYYVVNENGALEMWDNDGKITTASPPENLARE